MKNQFGKNRVILHSHTTNLISLSFVLPLNNAIFTRELWEMELAKDFKVNLLEKFLN